MSKPRKSIKLTPGKEQQLRSAHAEITTHYAPLVEAWPELTLNQRAAVLAASPLLASIIAWSQQFEETP